MAVWDGLEGLENGPKMKRYEDVAQQIVRLIDQGTLAPGERIPSVRAFSRTRSVSITTVLEAYRLLESQGYIEARPQSGYFVRARSQRICSEPEATCPAADPTHIGMGELMMRVLKDVYTPGIVQLGASMAMPDQLPMEKMHRILAAMGREHAERGILYDIPPGCPELRVQVARRALESGCSLRPEEIVTTVGCQEAMILCLRAVCKPGDAVAIESPTYYGVLQALEMLGLRALELPTHPRDGMSLDALQYALSEGRVRAVLAVTNFNNPMGSCMPDAKKEEMVRLLARHEVPLIEDDIHGDLCFTPTRPRAAKCFDTEGLVCLCSSFSKTLAPGYRVGWVAPGRFQAEVERLKFVNSISTATLPQLAVAHFLSTGGYDHHRRKLRRTYARFVTQMADAVGRFFPEGTRLTRPEGGSMLWVQMPPGVDSVRLYDRALKAGITFAPGPLFSAKGEYRNCLRLNCTHWSEAVERAVATLGELANSEVRDEV